MGRRRPWLAARPVVLCSALFGASGLAMCLGGLEAELEGETYDVDDRPSIGTTPRDPRH